MNTQKKYDFLVLSDFYFYDKYFSLNLRNYIFKSFLDGLDLASKSKDLGLYNRALVYFTNLYKTEVPVSVGIKYQAKIEQQLVKFLIKSKLSKKDLEEIKKLLDFINSSNHQLKLLNSHHLIRKNDTLIKKVIEK